MKNYSEMTDFEINCAVAQALGFNELARYQYGPRKKVCFESNDEPKDVSEGFTSQPCDFNPCNSWADAGPIIQENGIELGYDGIAWQASSKLRGVEPYSDWNNHPESPCRLAMIVFLMMQESK